MILKDLEKRHYKDVRRIAGYEAEKQMAYYLKRRYEEREDVVVINNLRLEHNGDYAQMDHVIVHRFGFFIVESKSITGTVKVNEHGEWSRDIQNKFRGIASPIEQVKRQIFLLKQFLGPRLGALGKSIIGRKLEVDGLKYDYLVSIADQGIIERVGFNSDRVLKADQIVDSIELYIAIYEKELNKLFGSSVQWWLKNETVVRLGRMLSDSHCAPDVEVKPNVVEIEKTTMVENYNHDIEKPDSKKPERQSCGKCQSVNVKIVYGKYGYYIKCDDCDGNSKIKVVCGVCNKKSKVSKSADKFYQVCGYCDQRVLFHLN